MKKLLVLLICLPLIGIGQFRNIDWGSPDHVIIKKYGKPDFDRLSEEHGTRALIYKNQKIGDLECWSIFHFLENKLFKGIVVMYPYNQGSKDVNGDWDGHIFDYQKWKNSLTKKYGNPSKDVEIWKNGEGKYTSMFNKNKGYYYNEALKYSGYNAKARAIGAGDLTMESFWFIKNNEIVCHLSDTPEDGPNLKITYISIDHKEWAENLIKQNENYHNKHNSEF